MTISKRSGGMLTQNTIIMWDIIRIIVAFVPQFGASLQMSSRILYKVARNVSSNSEFIDSENAIK